jgi:hypothetical protein
VLSCSLVVVVEGAFVRDRREIGRMGVMCRVGIVDCSASSGCGGGRGSGVIGRGM